MPRRTTRETVQCPYFPWLLYRREGVWYADGRSGQRDRGRHSLGTKDRAEAMQNLTKLDVTIAVRLGTADQSALAPDVTPLGLATGRKLYEDHLSRPGVAGGPGHKTKARYKAVLDKFMLFATKQRITNWNDVTQTRVIAYLADLERQDYGERTLYLEATTLKQLMKFLVDQLHLPAECLFPLRLKKPSGTSTYCWSREEVVAMIDHCQRTPALAWLGDVILVLCQTGLRISELAGLRWPDIDFDRNVIRITNDRGRRGQTRSNRRQTKNRRDRSFPIKRQLGEVLRRQPRTSDGCVFHGPRGGRLKPDTIRNIFIAEVLEPLANRFPTPEGEVGFTDGRLHSFRHYFCSRCADEGVREQVLMSWLGHSNSEMIRLYYHLSDEESQAQMKNVDFTGVGGGNGAAVPSPKDLEAPHDGQTARAAS